MQLRNQGINSLFYVFIFSVPCTLYKKKYLDPDADMSTFSTVTATSAASCSLMAEGKHAFIWQKEENRCLVSDTVPGKCKHFFGPRSNGYVCALF